MTTDANTYFANRHGTDLATAVGERIDVFHDFCRQTGLFGLWLKAFRRYYGMDRDGFSSHEVRRAGVSGEQLRVCINHFRSILQQFISLSTGTRKALEPVGTTDTFESEKEVRLAKGVLEFAMRACLEKAIQASEESAVVLGGGGTQVTWNSLGGDLLMEAAEATDTSPAQPALFTGMFEAFSFMPQDVAFDPFYRDGEVPWRCTRRWVNRHDLVAQVAGADEKLRDKILNLKPGRREKELDFRQSVFQDGVMRRGDRDQVVLWEFWHERTPACPNGRHAQFLSDDVFLKAEDMPYEGIPIKFLHPSMIMGTHFGYTTAWDLLAPQEMVDRLKSIEITGQATHGLGLVAVPKGSGVSATELGKGLTLFEYNPGTNPPQGVQLGAMDPTIVSNQQRIVQDMETVSGINSVVRGQPEASLKSGSALALVQAQAIQSSALFQKNDVHFTEALGDLTISIFKQYASDELKMEVEGADGLLVSNSVKGSDLSTVNRVRVDVGNPLTRTIAGRVQLATDLIQNKLVMDPMQFVRVLETGRLEPLTSHESRARSNIKAENEMLSRARFKTGPDGKTLMQDQVDPTTGQPTGKMEGVLDDSTLPVALKTDDPRLHVQEHRSVLDDPRMRRRPEVVRAVTAHIKAHQEQYAAATLLDPGLLELINVPPSASALMAAGGMAPGPASMPSPDAGGAKPAGGNAAALLDPTAGGPAQPNLPKLPPGAASATGVNPSAPGPTGQA